MSNLYTLPLGVIRRALGQIASCNYLRKYLSLTHARQGQRSLGEGERERERRRERREKKREGERGERRREKEREMLKEKWREGEQKRNREGRVK